MSLVDEIAAVSRLFDKYDKVPASLADACLIRLSELYDRSRVLNDSLPRNLNEQGD